MQQLGLASEMDSITKTAQKTASNGVNTFLIATRTQYKLEQISWVSFKRPENNQSHCIDPGHMSNDILQMRKWNSETISLSPTSLWKVMEESKWLVGKQIDVF